MYMYICVHIYMLITRYDLKQDNVFKLPHTDACLHWNVLTHLYQLLPHICVSELGHHWFRQWLVVCSVPSHYLNQNWLIVNWTLGNKFQWNFNRKSIIFIRENAFGIVVCHNDGHFVRGKMNLYLFSPESPAKIPPHLWHICMRRWLAVDDVY